jgi:hypothetical protein
MEWKHLKKFKTQPLMGKVMLTLFWDAHGPILEQCQEVGTAMNSFHYNEILWDQLKPAIQTKGRRLLLKGVTMLYDNASPHTAARSVETLCQLNSEC